LAEKNLEGEKYPIMGGFCVFGVFCCGENVVKLWWNAWLTWCFSSHFFGAEKYATFLNFIFNGRKITAGPTGAAPEPAEQ
jgi:hypothetical protein